MSVEIKYGASVESDKSFFRQLKFWSLANYSLSQANLFGLQKEETGLRKEGIHWHVSIEGWFQTQWDESTQMMSAEPGIPSSLSFAF